MLGEDTGMGMNYIGVYSHIWTCDIGTLSNTLVDEPCLDTLRVMVFHVKNRDSY